MAKWETIKHRETKERQEKTIPKTGEYLGDLNFDYAITSNGDIAWKPVRVYNDGQKTIIQMPAAMAQTEAPTLLVIRKEGDIFTGKHFDPDVVSCGSLGMGVVEMLNKTVMSQ